MSIAYGLIVINSFAIREIDGYELSYDNPL
nr:MAG TPA: hypothetical protein [Caudoviricetes sp.]